MEGFISFILWMLVFAGICAGCYLWYRLAWRLIQWRMEQHYGE